MKADEIINLLDKSKNKDKDILLITSGINNDCICVEFCENIEPELIYKNQ